MQAKHFPRYRSEGASKPGHGGFTLIELIVVIVIISLLIALLAPSLSRSRKQAKAAHCLTRLKEIGSATAVYATAHKERMPPASIAWHPTQERMRSEGIAAEDLPGYGWAELLYEDAHQTSVISDRSHYPAQRNFEGRYGAFDCPEAQETITHSSHYRVYLPGWAREAYGVDDEGQIRPLFPPLNHSTRVSKLDPELVIAGDATENSAEGDYEGGDRLLGGSGRGSCSVPDNPYIGIEGCYHASAGTETMYNQANAQYPTRDCQNREPNRFSHRHAGANYLFGDFHAERSGTMRERLGCDWDLNGVHDVKGDQSRLLSGCPDREED